MHTNLFLMRFVCLSSFIATFFFPLLIMLFVFFLIYCLFNFLLSSFLCFIFLFFSLNIYSGQQHVGSGDLTVPHTGGMHHMRLS